MSIFNPTMQQAYWTRKQQAWEALKNLPRIPELDLPLERRRYLCITEDEAFSDFVDDAQILSISGAYFGDESKGKIGNLLAKWLKQRSFEEDRRFATLRPNSGANTGRTVFIGEEMFVFHNIPSSIAYGIDAYMGSECVADIVAMLEEEVFPYAQRGIDFSHLKMGNVAITMPYHRIMDVVGSLTNSSTGVGIKQTHMSMKEKTCPRLDDLFNHPAHLERLILRDMEMFEGFLHTKKLTRETVLEKLRSVREVNKRIVPNHVLEFLTSSQPAKYLVELYQGAAQQHLSGLRVDVPRELERILREKGRILMEPTQSYFLSNAVEQGYKESTSADTTLAGALASSGISPHRYKIRNLNVQKAPGSSRVGIGNIPGGFTFQDRFSSEGIDRLAKLGDACQDFPAVLAAYFNAVGNNGLVRPEFYEDDTGKYEVGEAMAITCARYYGETGSTTGKPRVTGNFDAVFGAQVTERQGPYQFISAIDRGNHCSKVGLVVAHVVCFPSAGEFLVDEGGRPFLDSNGRRYYQGDIIRAGEALPSSSSEVTRHCLPIIRVIRGWEETPVRELKPGMHLPDAVADFVTAINQYTGSETMGIGIGKKEMDVAYLRRVE